MNEEYGAIRFKIKKTVFRTSNSHKELWLQIPARMDFLKSTGDVERAFQESCHQTCIIASVFKLESQGNQIDIF